MFGSDDYDDFWPFLTFFDDFRDSKNFKRINDDFCDKWRKLTFIFYEFIFYDVILRQITSIDVNLSQITEFLLNLLNKTEFFEKW